MRVAAYPACVPFTNSKTHVPTHLDSAKQGDALTTLSSDALAWPHVLDYTMVHPLNTDGSWNLNAVSEAYKNKMRKHDRAYNQQNIAFVPCVVTTCGYLDDDFVRLLYILAMRQAENIIAVSSTGSGLQGHPRTVFLWLQGTSRSCVRKGHGDARALVQHARAARSGCACCFSPTTSGSAPAH